jgi:drug/metabolite transporter (DMT)-like permease
VLDWVTNLLRFFIMLPIVLSNLPRAKAKMKGYWLLAFGVGALFGMLILGERVTAWRVVGCAILIGGVVLLGSASA